MGIGKQKAIVLAGLAMLLVATVASGCSGDNKAIQAVKARHFISYPDMSIGDMFAKGLKEPKWSQEAGPSEGVNLVQVSGVFVGEKGEQTLVSLKFKVIPATGLIQPITIFFDGKEFEPSAISEFVSVLVSKAGVKAKSRPVESNMKTAPTTSEEAVDDRDSNAISADSSALSNLKIAYTAAQAYFVDNPNGTVTLPLLVQTGLVISPDEVQVMVDNGTAKDLALSSVHEDGRMFYQVDAKGNYTEARRDFNWDPPDEDESDEP